MGVGAKKRWEGAQKGTGGGLATAGLLGGAAVGAGLAAKDLKRGKLLDAAKKVTTSAGAGWTAGSLAGATRGAVKAAAAYKLQGRQEFQGLKISIENRKGSTRKWFDPHGKETGSTHMHWGYGYIRGTLGTDGDHVDVYIGPNPDASHAFVVNQMKKPEGGVKDGKAWTVFDEQKVMLGWDSAKAAAAAYNKQYDDPRFFGSMTAMAMPEFKEKVMAKANHGKKVAAAHRLQAVKAKLAEIESAEPKEPKAPESPLYTPAVRKAATKLANGDMIEYFQKHPEKLKAYKERQAKKKAELTKVAAAMFEEFEYLPEAEKTAILNTLARLGGRGLRAGSQAMARGAQGALRGGKKLQAAGRLRQIKAKGLMPGAGEVDAAVSRGSRGVSAAGKATGVAASTKARGGLLSAKNVAKAGVLGTMGAGMYAGKKVLDTGASLAGGQDHGAWSVPGVQSRGRVF